MVREADDVGFGGSKAGPATTLEIIGSIRVSGYREQYAGIHFEARIHRLTFLPDLHDAAE